MQLNQSSNRLDFVDRQPSPLHLHQLNEKQINNNNDNNQFDTQNLKIKLENDINSSLSTRKKYTVSSLDISNLLYCCCCLNTPKARLINNVLEFIENSVEIGNIIKINRDIDVIKRVLLNKEQRNVNMNTSLNIISEDIGNEEELYKDGEFLEKLNDANLNIKNMTSI